MEKTKLNVRDFITIGVISAIAVVLFFVIGTLMGTTPIGWLFMHSVLAIPFGVLYMLLYTKVPKKGVVLLGSLMIVLLQLMNNWLIPAIMLGFFVINELIWSQGSQKKFSKMVTAFTIFMTGWAIASFSPILLLKDTYIAQFGDRAAYFEEAYNALAGPIGIGVLAGVIIASIAGAFLGRAILKKHFEKAGIV
jgi:energy-coupling factor transport system substrate-specific component